MNKEDFFINQFHSHKIGDDGAVVGKFVYSKDLFFEDIHFKREWMSLTQIAQKAMLVNISDVVAMNAKPLYTLIGIEIPVNFSNDELKELADGFKKVAKKYDFKIIGGDTIAGDRLNISITIISKAKKPTLRKGICDDDLMVYTGNLGSVKRDLQMLFAGKNIDKKSKFFKPKLRDKFMKKAAFYMTSCMDISDGLSFELERLSRINKVGFEFMKKIEKDVICSGEEYELLFSINKKHKEKVIKIAHESRTKLNFFAVAKRGKKYICDCKPHHF